MMTLFWKEYVITPWQSGKCGNIAPYKVEAVKRSLMQPRRTKRVSPAQLT
ncbi:MAG: hypothetical protein ABFD07_09440 [Methanobacterium sp.]